MLTKLLIILSALTLTACESIKARNIIKTGATTAVTYAVAGPIPAVINLGTSIVIDEVLPEENTVSDIEKGNKEQMFAFITDKFLIYVLYGFIGFLVFTNILGPWAAQRRARRQMKYQQLEEELANLKKD
jgi:hypothetical protein